MADVAEENAEGGEEQVEAARDVEISALFRAGGQEEPEEPETPPAEKPPEAPKPVVDDSRLAGIEAQLAALNRRNAELETENNMHRMGLTRPQQPQQPVTQPQPKGLLEELGYTKEQLNEGLRTDAAGTITDVVERATKAAYAKARADAVAEANGSVRGEMQRQQAFQSDQRAMVSEYGELYNSNQEYHALADQVYDRIVKSTPGAIQLPEGNWWAPNAMYTAASVAFAQMTKAGKFKDNVVNLSERKPKPQAPVIGDSASGSNAGDKRSGAFYQDHNAEQVLAAKSTAKRLGVPFEDYVKRYNQLKKENPGYGSGN